MKTLHLPTPMRKLWWRNRRADLLAPNTKILATNNFIVFDEAVPKGATLVVRAIVPYAQKRTNPGTAQESFETILPVKGNGWFLFEPLIAVGTPIEILADLNAAQNAIDPATGLATIPNNDDRWVGRGFTDISDDPISDAGVYLASGLSMFAVPSEQHMRIVFRLLTSSNGAVALANPISNPFQIAAGAPEDARVDFAGAVIVGELLPETLYKRLQEEAEAA